MAIEHGGTMGQNLGMARTEGPDASRNRFPNPLRRFPLFRSKTDSDVVDSTNIDNAILPTSNVSDAEREQQAKDWHIADVLPHDLSVNPLTSEDIKEIEEWARHPEVKGRVYQLEGGDESLYRGTRRRSMYTDYYTGRRDDEGNETNPEDSIFPKAVDQHGNMLATTRLRLRGVPYIRTEGAIEWERLLVDPEFLGKKIGLGFSLSVLDIAMSLGKEVRDSVYIDVDAARNLNLMTLLGFKAHGPARQVNGGRWIQPLRNFADGYMAARPRAIDHLGHDQPSWAERLEKDGKELQRLLDQRRSGR